MSRLPDGTPILCQACGAEAELGHELEVRCPYCGAADRLPPDELGRALAIKARLATGARRVAQLSGMDAALGSVFGDPRAVLRATGLYLAVGLLTLLGVIVWAVPFAMEHGSALGARLTTQVVMTNLAAPLLVLAGVLWAGVALARGRSVFERSVRPQLLARAPAAQGQPFGCRACGGPLPTVIEPGVTCRYCRTQNLVPRALHAQRSEALEARSAALSQQSHHATAQMTSVARVVQTTFAAGMAISVVFVFVLLALLR